MERKKNWFFKKEKASADDTAAPAEQKNIRLIKYSLIANLVLVIGIAAAIGGMAVIEQSDTNPAFCGTCHVMQANVNSYLTSNHLDNVHQQAGVQCKECHDYPLMAEIASGVNYMTGNYEVVSADNPALAKRTFGEEMCTKCHGTMEQVARKTDYLKFNPHDAEAMGSFTCSDCHVSHGAQIDTCGECHSNGGQRLIEDTTSEREKIDDEAAH